MPLVVVTPGDLQTIVREAIRAELAPNDREAVVDLAEALPGSKDAIYRRARRGEIPGAKKLGRKWVATREAVRLYVESIAAPSAPAPANDGTWTPESALRRAGVRIAGGTK